jgi:glutamyl-tRNA reductase
VEASSFVALRTVVGRYLASRKHFDEGEISEHSYQYQSAAAVRHLFSVAAGLDSIALGEDQIVCQLKDALKRAQRSATGGQVLHHLMQVALRVAKRVRTETMLNATGRSLASVGLQHIKQEVGSLAGKRALVIGAGSMGAIATAALRREGVVQVDVANRSLDRAHRLAATAKGRALRFAEVPAALAHADIVVCCTGATGVIIELDDVREAAVRRNGRRLAFLDIAAPHNVSVDVVKVRGVALVSLAQLAEDAKAQASSAAITAAKDIVDVEVQSFHRERREARAGRAVSALRTTAAELLDTELAALARRMPELDERTDRELARALRRIVDKLLYTPTLRARELASAPEGTTYVHVLNTLFEADPQ